MSFKTHIHLQLVCYTRNSTRDLLLNNVIRKVYKLNYFKILDLPRIESIKEVKFLNLDKYLYLESSDIDTQYKIEIDIETGEVIECRQDLYILGIVPNTVTYPDPVAYIDEHIINRTPKIWIEIDTKETKEGVYSL